MVWSTKARASLGRSYRLSFQRRSLRGHYDVPGIPYYPRSLNWSLTLDSFDNECEYAVNWQGNFDFLATLPLSIFHGNNRNSLLYTCRGSTDRPTDPFDRHSQESGGDFASCCSNRRSKDRSPTVRWNIILGTSCIIQILADFARV